MLLHHLRSLMLLCLGGVAVAACDPSALDNRVQSIPSSPAQVAQTTQVDELARGGLEAGYFAARVAVEAMVDLGKLKGENAARAQTLNRQAYAALLRVRRLDGAVNSPGYLAAFAELKAATADLSAIVQGASR